ncbi:uncharacterized protein LOC121951075 [Plectropomus leopardus]|uniref:uncharacterized protein LOC121951075 n=1 Tax=Plectropomus leopardus TaxID=160734 RepID=UPI001C4BC0B5|nr:uncharacterized protein LOC121951075 [Plectropomus leopardus]
MGNMQCPAEDAALLASVARDICPFPDYNPSPLLLNMLSANSSLHLRNYYVEVQSSLTPKQLEDFTQDLRTTFGRKGRVNLGGVGVVALSLAVLFDTLGRQVRGEWVPHSGPIPGLFAKDLRGHYPPHVYTVSEFLRLLPYIANNPTRMREETERYLKQLMIDERSNQNQGNDAITGVNLMFGTLFQNSLRIHLLRIANSTVVDDIIKSVRKHETGVDAAHVSKTRKRRIPAPENTVIFNLNCDPEAASKAFLAEVNKTTDTQEAFRLCQPFNRNIPKTFLHFIARLAWLDVINDPIFDFKNQAELLTAQREDFDLKAYALRKWAE